MMRLNFLPLWLVFMLSLVLSGCGENINQYKERVQQDNDRRNPTANKAMCLIENDKMFYQWMKSNSE